MKKILFAFLLSSFSCLSVATPLKVIYANLQGRDPQRQFSFAVLNLALEKSGLDVELVKSSQSMTDARAIVEIMNKNIDVAWLGNSAEVESQLWPIMIPISRGLLGYRIPVIRTDLQSRFNQVKTLADLQKFQACLGVGWPIATAWDDNALPVTAVGTFESLFKMTISGRMDYIPFGAGSVHDYVKQYAEDNPALMIDQHVVIVYPYYDFFFFVNKENKILHEAIEMGFKKAYEDGSYRDLFISHPEFAGLKSLQLEKRQAIRLKNIHVTPQDIEIKSKYWINPQTPFLF